MIRKRLINQGKQSQNVGRCTSHSEICQFPLEFCTKNIETELSKSKQANDNKKKLRKNKTIPKKKRRKHCGKKRTNFISVSVDCMHILMLKKKKKYEKKNLLVCLVVIFSFLHEL